MILATIKRHNQYQNIYALEVKLLKQVVNSVLVVEDAAFDEDIVQWLESGVCFDWILSEDALEYFVLEHEVDVDGDLVTNMQRYFVGAN